MTQLTLNDQQDLSNEPQTPQDIASPPASETTSDAPTAAPTGDPAPIADAAEAQAPKRRRRTAAELQDDPRFLARQAKRKAAVAQAASVAEDAPAQAQDSPANNLVFGQAAAERSRKKNLASDQAQGDGLTPPDGGGVVFARAADGTIMGTLPEGAESTANNEGIGWPKPGSFEWMDALAASGALPSQIMQEDQPLTLAERKHLRGEVAKDLSRFIGQTQDIGKSWPRHPRQFVFGVSRLITSVENNFAFPLGFDDAMALLFSCVPQAARPIVKALLVEDTSTVAASFKAKRK